MKTRGRQVAANVTEKLILLFSLHTECYTPAPNLAYLILIKRALVDLIVISRYLE